MHKLRKPNKESPQSRPYEAEVLKSGGTMQSRTMIYARAAAVDLNPLQVTPTTVSIPTIPLSAKPKTVTERYWAERAITAETLLSVKAARHEEARVLAVTEAHRLMAYTAVDSPATWTLDRVYCSLGCARARRHLELHTAPGACRPSLSPRLGPCGY